MRMELLARERWLPRLFRCAFFYILGKNNMKPVTACMAKKTPRKFPLVAKIRLIAHI